MAYRWGVPITTYKSWDGPPSGYTQDIISFVLFPWKVLSFPMPNLNPNPRFKVERTGRVGTILDPQVGKNT